MTTVRRRLGYHRPMHVICPKGKEATEIAEAAHYSEVECPHCGSRFQAVTEATQQASRECLDELLGSAGKSGESDG